MHNILAALGLAETATEQEAIALIQAMRAQLAAMSATKKPTVPIVALAAAEPSTPVIDLGVYAPRRDLNAMEARAVAVEAVVDQAVANRTIAPASTQEYLNRLFCNSVPSRNSRRLRTPKTIRCLCRTNICMGSGTGAVSAMAFGNRRWCGRSR